MNVQYPNPRPFSVFGFPGVSKRKPCDPLLSFMIGLLLASVGPSDDGGNLVFSFWLSGGNLGVNSSTRIDSHAYGQAGQVPLASVGHEHPRTRAGSSLRVAPF